MTITGSPAAKAVHSDSAGSRPHQAAGDVWKRSLGRWLWPERFRPWQGKPTHTDLALTGAFLAVILLGFVVRPIKPFLIASHPVALQVVSGDLIATGAAAAFARLGQVPLWLVVVAGAIGMVKFDWLLWWAGRCWGEGMIRMVASPQQARRYAVRAADLSPWLIRIAVVGAVLPGIPTPIVFAFAGITGMPLLVFLALDLAGALLMAGLVAGLGYGLGQHAVDVVLVIDRYASFVSLVLLAVAFLTPWLWARLQRYRGISRRGAATTPLSSSGQAPSSVPGLAGGDATVPHGCAASEDGGTAQTPARGDRA